MLALTPLGIIHTLISLIAVLAGAMSLVLYREISPRKSVGRLYVWTTVLTCLTGFPIMQHGGFGKPHALGIITLVALTVAWSARRRKWFGDWAPYVAVVSYSATFCFHLIPALVETTTRLPLGAPLIADREGPELKAVSGVLIMLLIIGATLQVRAMRSKQTVAATA